MHWTFRVAENQQLAREAALHRESRKNLVAYYIRRMVTHAVAFFAACVLVGSALMVLP